MLASFLSGEFRLHIPCSRYCFIGEVSLTHPVLAEFLYGEFLLHIPSWRHFYLGSISCTSRTGFIFVWGVSLAPPVLALI